ncbi:MAG: methyltransferase domain-containing protein [Marmoricola sp.]
MAESGNLLDCTHFDAFRCRSCTWLDVSYAEQLGRKSEHVRSLIGDAVVWEPPHPSPLGAFRNKAKLVVSGTVDRPVLGILGPEGPVDLRDCPLYEPAIQHALPIVADFVTASRLVPYDIGERRGELKYILVTSAPSGDLMIRFVLRSTESELRIRKHLPSLIDALPTAVVVSLNIQPEHKAILEGEREILLTSEAALAIPVNDVSLRLRPQSFFQTNTAVAAALYRGARRFTADLGAETAWDLYCGVGGFALHLARPGLVVAGVEISAEAVASAQSSAPPGVAFIADDALAYASREVAAGQSPDLIVVNPPRRGIGDLAAFLESSAIPAVLYSSCNAESLARDLAAMPSLRPVRAQVYDMFPHTDHYEVLTLLQR